MKLELEGFLSKIGKNLPGEHYGKQISRTELELSPYYIPRDMKNLLGISDEHTKVRARFFPLIVMPWDNVIVGQWTEASLYDAVEILCGHDIPEYISGTDTQYASETRVLHLEAGNLSGPIRIKESKHPYCKMDVLVQKN